MQRVSTVGQTTAAKNESSYEASYILYYVVFNLVDKTVLLKLFWHRNDRIRIFLLLFSCSVVSDSLLPHGLQYTRLPSPSLSLSLFISIESTMLSNHLMPCHPLLLLSSIFASIRVFSSEWALCIRWPKYWSFSFSIGPSKEHSGLISFRIDWLDILAVQGTLKSLLKHQSPKASILQCSAFFILQLSHLYMTTGKTIALTRWTFVGKVMSAC